MSTTLSPGTNQIAAAFAEEITSLGGTVRDSHDDGEALFARAVLPRHDEVRRGDRIQGGVALRTTGPLILIHPYTFRLVCTNGAIVAHVTATHEVRRVEYASAVEFASAALDEVRLLVRRCADPGVLRDAVGRMRGATEMAADLVVQMMGALQRVPVAQRAMVMQLMTGRFEREERTLYGAFNAITATARDTGDRAIRWDLEEYAGSLLPQVRPAPRARVGAALVEA